MIERVSRISSFYQGFLLINELRKQWASQVSSVVMILWKPGSNDINTEEIRFVKLLYWVIDFKRTQSSKIIYYLWGSLNRGFLASADLRRFQSSFSSTLYLDGYRECWVMVNSRAITSVWTVYTVWTNKRVISPSTRACSRGTVGSSSNDARFRFITVRDTNSDNKNSVYDD